MALGMSLLLVSLQKADAGIVATLVFNKSNYDFIFYVDINKKNT